MIFIKPYNFSTYSLFKDNRIMNLEKLYKFNLCKSMYRYMNNLVPEILKEMYILNENVHYYNTGNREMPHFYHIKYNQYLNSFIIQGPKIWVRVPNEIKNSDKFHLFNKKLKTYLLSI